ncbi:MULTISPECIES: hypothetical protein [unclassified Corynebacterium]|uniref:hypothetical protein n=1 Tax=unclassified Corynebacterium TaxID=2624378 RepID=UPI00264CF25A|nr:MULTISPECIES: hypothetical protein [unclassified Corynebacterium]MDN8594826.1 hypothetical protein [Corynebacterium sp. P4_F2]WKK56326.1 hypothetical protein QYR03_03690 [Corynebacterium sp. P4-C1]
MALFRNRKDDKKNQAASAPAAMDAKEIEKNANFMGRTFIKGLDRAVRLQSGVIRAYVDHLRRSNPEASPAEIQTLMDKHFMYAASGTGAGAGGAAAVPGIGFFTGAAAVAGESLVFVDLAAVYTVGSAYLRGVDISDAERRRAIVLMVLSGSQGAAIVDTLVGPDAQKLPSVAMVSKFSGPTLSQANSLLTRSLMKSMKRRLRRMWLGKLMPLGIGAVAGAMANRALAKKVIEGVNPNLGQPPAEFANELPAKSEVEDEFDAAEKNTTSRVKSFLAIFSRNRDKEEAGAAGATDADVAEAEAAADAIEKE